MYMPCASLLQYLVKRKGTDHTSYGLVDAKAIKRQRLDNTGPDTGPVPLSLVDEYEDFVRGFKQAVHDHREGSALDLGGPSHFSCNHASIMVISEARHSVDMPIVNKYNDLTA